MTDIKNAFKNLSSLVETIVDHFRISPSEVEIDWQEQVLFVRISAANLSDLAYCNESFDHFCQNGIPDMNGSMVFMDGMVCFSFTPKENKPDLRSDGKLADLKYNSGASLVPLTHHEIKWTHIELEYLAAHMNHKRVSDLVWVVTSLRNRHDRMTLVEAKELCEAKELDLAEHS